MGALEWLAADRHPTFPNEEKDERAETSDDSDERGVFVEIVKRSGCAASSAGRRDICARIDDALRASTVLEYNILIAPRVKPYSQMMKRSFLLYRMMTRGKAAVR